ncbi:hypothetical protein [Pseudomonas coronafaciens]|uniref:hypothetical protein n=1 Tax=Pseudomonas coronafaciens TaxID=53409 RepID=UPI000EFF8435|nr:hypothetical protein [Pseudomonas coronafaciens]
MSRHHNGPVGQRLIQLWQLLQLRDTTFGQVIDLAAQCGIDGRRVLADHFSKPAIPPARRA